MRTPLIRAFSDDELRKMEMDDLTKIRGIGNLRQRALNNLGIFTYKHLVEVDARELAPKLGALVTVTSVEEWQQQASQMEE